MKARRLRGPTGAQDDGLDDFLDNEWDWKGNWNEFVLLWSQLCEIFQVFLVILGKPSWGRCFMGSKGPGLAGQSRIHWRFRNYWLQMTHASLQNCSSTILRRGLVRKVGNEIRLPPRIVAGARTETLSACMHGIKRIADEQGNEEDRG